MELPGIIGKKLFKLIYNVESILKKICKKFCLKNTWKIKFLVCFLDIASPIVLVSLVLLEIKIKFKEFYDYNLKFIYLFILI